MSERFDPDEVAASVRLDRAADDVLAGGAPRDLDAITGAVVERLVRGRAAEPPPALADRVGGRLRRERRYRLAVRIAAVALALLFVAQGLGSLFAGSWVARNLDVAFDSHAFIEGGIVLVALGLVMLGGALERRWLDLAVIAGVPVGIAFAAHGASELAEFPAGGILHLSQGLAAVALGALWWRSRRYVFAPRAKRGHGR
jgi:nitroreductase